MEIEKLLCETVSKNNFQLFKTREWKLPSKMKSKLSNMKNDLQLFYKMYISCQARNGDINVFFYHENHSWPPSLSVNNMRLEDKPELPDIDGKILTELFSSTHWIQKLF